LTFAALLAVVAPTPEHRRRRDARCAAATLSTWMTTATLKHLTLRFADPRPPSCKKPARRVLPFIDLISNARCAAISGRFREDERAEPQSRLCQLSESHHNLYVIRID